MTLKEEFLKEEDPQKMLELYKKLSSKDHDKETTKYFNDVIKKQGQENQMKLFGDYDPNRVYEIRKRR